ncbi:MAG: hypothetical protein CMC97_04165 [Flavobacteriales bacterium]|nr:hypothetical protein [Flavobacteriales bacterium]
MNRFLSHLLKSSVLLTLLVGFNSAQAQWPYNPNADGDDNIGAADILEILGLFGSTWEDNGVLGIASGGTGAESADSARVALGLSFISDSTTTQGINTYVWTWVEDDFRVTGQMAQGRDVTAPGSYASALGDGSDAIGNYSHAVNRNTTATGTCSSAMGEGTEATGTASHAQGMFTDATATTAHAEGYNTKAQANYAHSEGYGTVANNTAAHAEGYNTTASGFFSHASNRNTVASATCAHAVGEGTQATADASASEGFYTVASGFAGHAEGYETTASAFAASAGGYYTIADQAYQTAVGKYNVADQAGVLFAVGNGDDVDNRSDALQIKEDGSAVLAGDLQFGGVSLEDTLSALNSRITALEEAIETLILELNGPANE